MRLAMVGAFSSLFWAGCASDRAYENTAMKPVNMLASHANTYPAKRTGLDDYSQSTSLSDLPSSVIVEQAGAERR